MEILGLIEAQGEIEDEIRVRVMVMERSMVENA